MMFDAVTRRAFLTTSAGAVAALAVAAVPVAVQAGSRQEPSGVVYGRAGRRGIPPGTASAPSRGEVVLLDGRVLEVSHATGRGIGEGRSVLLSPGERGGWSIIYAEF
jgi:hypothetical protein